LRLQTLFIGAFVILVLGIIFSLSFEMLSLLIPSLFFSGVVGGIFVGIKRKRPMINCMYDGFIVSIPASFILGLVLIPLFWFYHDIQSLNIAFGPFFFMVFSGAIMLTGIVGGPIGGLITGAYYRYLKQDRGEGELYETYLEDKISDDNQKSSVDILADLES